MPSCRGSTSIRRCAAPVRPVAPGAPDQPAAARPRRERRARGRHLVAAARSPKRGASVLAGCRSTVVGHRPASAAGCRGPETEADQPRRRPPAVHRSRRAAAASRARQPATTQAAEKQDGRGSGAGAGRRRKPSPRHLRRTAANPPPRGRTAVAAQAAREPDADRCECRERRSGGRCRTIEGLAPQSVELVRSGPGSTPAGGAAALSGW